MREGLHGYEAIFLCGPASTCVVISSFNYSWEYITMMPETRETHKPLENTQNTEKHIEHYKNDVNCCIIITPICQNTFGSDTSEVSISCITDNGSYSYSCMDTI